MLVLERKKKRGMHGGKRGACANENAEIAIKRRDRGDEGEEEGMYNCNGHSGGNAASWYIRKTTCDEQ